MWPDLTGPGWEQHVLATAILMAAVLASFSLVARTALRRESAEPDPLLTLWHGYETGDVTQREFERRKKALTGNPGHEPVAATGSFCPPAMDLGTRVRAEGRLDLATRGAAADQ